MGWGAFAAAATEIAQTAGQYYANHREAKMQRQWQERFYQNRHQWEVADLRAAGLNPVLSAMNGGGSVPSGATAQMNGQSIANTASRASEVSRENSVRKETEELLKAQTHNARMTSEFLATQNWKTEAETRALIANNYTSMLKMEEINSSPKLRNLIQKEAWTDSIGRHSNSAGKVTDIIKGIF